MECWISDGIIHIFRLYASMWAVTYAMVVCVLVQTEISGNVESSAAVDIQFPVEVTGGGLRPVVRLEKLDLTR